MKKIPGIAISNREYSDPAAQKIIADNINMQKVEELGTWPGISTDPWLPDPVRDNDGCSVWGYAQLNVRAHWDKLKNVEPFKSVIAVAQFAGTPMGVSEGQGYVWAYLIDKIEKCVGKKIEKAIADNANPAPLRRPGGGYIPGHGPTRVPAQQPDPGWPETRRLDPLTHRPIPRGLSEGEIAAWALCCKCHIMQSFGIEEKIRVKTQNGHIVTLQWGAINGKCLREMEDTFASRRMSCINYSQAMNPTPDEWDSIEDLLGYEIYPPDRQPNDLGPAWPPTCGCIPNDPQKNTVNIVLHVARLRPKDRSRPWSLAGHIIGGVATCNPDPTDPTKILNWDIAMTESPVSHSPADPLNPMAPTWTGTVSHNPPGIIIKVNEPKYKHYEGEMVVGLGEICN